MIPMPAIVWKALGVLGAACLIALYAHSVGYASASRDCATQLNGLQQAHDAAFIAAQRKARDAEERAAEAQAVIDRLHEGLQNAQTANDDLRRQLSAGLVRVRFNASHPAGGSGLRPSTGSTGVGDGKAGCELDPATAERVAGIAADGDRAVRKMTALQNYINTVVLPTCGTPAQ